MAGLGPVQVAAVAGSGLDLRGLFDGGVRELGFEEVPGLQAAAVPGSPGRFVAGTCQGIPLVLQEGRLHMYEGLSYEQATQTVKALAAWGAKRLIVTNAAGGLRPELEPGSLVGLERIALWPCLRWPDRPETLTPDPFPGGHDARGSYLWVHGPCYETPAEIRAMRGLGHSVAGMSAGPEVCRAQRLGLRTAAVSCVTNRCGSGETLTHADVLRVAGQASARLTAVLRQAIAGMRDR